MADIETKFDLFKLKTDSLIKIKKKKSVSKLYSGL